VHAPLSVSTCIVGMSSARGIHLDERFHEGGQKGGIHLRLEAHIWTVGLGQGLNIMAEWRRAIELSLGNEDWTT